MRRPDHRRRPDRHVPDGLPLEALQDAGRDSAGGFVGIPNDSSNGDYATTAGLVPTRDAIAIEDAKGPYANLIAVRIVDRDEP